jgi:hypothetical protein
VARLGDRFGHTDGAAGKRVIVEHTSSNPNAPLHIGNLRNVMIGAHLARLLAAVGYEVKQSFYVNDLGAQIGLTALAYEKCYPLLKPSMKIDQWIGCMYAVMNTCQELQRVGVDPGELESAYAADQAAVDALQAKCVAHPRALHHRMRALTRACVCCRALAAAGDDEKKASGVAEYIDIYGDLRKRCAALLSLALLNHMLITSFARYLPMMEVMIPVVRLRFFFGLRMLHWCACTHLMLRVTGAHHSRHPEGGRAAQPALRAAGAGRHQDLSQGTRSQTTTEPCMTVLTVLPPFPRRW